MDVSSGCSPWLRAAVLAAGITGFGSAPAIAQAPDLSKVEFRSEKLGEDLHALFGAGGLVGNLRSRHVPPGKFGWSRLGSGGRLLGGLGDRLGERGGGPAQADRRADRDDQDVDRTTRMLGTAHGA